MLVTTLEFFCNCYVLSGAWKESNGLIKHDMLGDIPHDPIDFHRCHKLLEAIPEWKKRLGEVADIFPKWKPIIDNWDELARLYESEKNNETAPLLYEKLQELNIL